MSSENPDLNMGITFATLIASGNIPVVKDKFISLHSGKVRHGADMLFTQPSNRNIKSE